MTAPIHGYPDKRCTDGGGAEPHYWREVGSNDWFYCDARPAQSESKPAPETQACEARDDMDDGCVVPVSSAVVHLHQNALGGWAQSWDERPAAQSEPDPRLGYGVAVTGSPRGITITDLHYTRHTDPQEDPVDTPTDRTEEIKRKIEELKTWWVELHTADIDTTAPKAIEYGAADLAVMGKAMEHLIPNRAKLVEQGVDVAAYGVEMAIAFYLLGKVARLYGAYEQGRLPSEDTLFDCAVYTGMLRKVRATGEWV